MTTIIHPQENEKCQSNAFQSKLTKCVLIIRVGDLGMGLNPERLINSKQFLKLSFDLLAI